MWLLCGFSRRTHQNKISTEPDALESPFQWDYERDVMILQVVSHNLQLLKNKNQMSTTISYTNHSK